MHEYNAVTQACLTAWGESRGEGSAGALALGEYLDTAQTPCYLYSAELIDQRLRELRKHLPQGVSLQYAVKANPNLALLKRLSGNVDGFDIASNGEQALSLQAGMPATKLSFAGPGKTNAELREALNAGVTISLESLGEIQRLGQLATELQLTPRVLLRINPDYDIRSSGMHMGGRASPFGIDQAQIGPAFGEIKAQGLELLGLHIFIASQSLDVQALNAVRAKNVQLMRQLDLQWQSLGGKALQIFNIGGGWGIPYFPNDTALPLAELCTGMEQQLALLRSDNSDAIMVLELGRYLVGEAGIYLTKVIDIKQSFGETFLITDGGMNHHLAASGNLGQVIRRNYPVAIANRLTSEQWQTVTISGPLCTPLDVLASGVDLPRAEVGDIIAVFQSGAYGLSASPQGFLSHPVAGECWL